MFHPLSTLYRELTDLLKEEENALREEDHARLRTLSATIHKRWQQIDSHTGKMPTDLPPEARSQLSSLLSNLLRQVADTHQAWLSHREDLKAEQKTMTTARRFVAEAKLQPVSGKRFSRSA
ncbi:MAG TPA: hypothetical protein VKZ59_10530 [Acidobacteriota bacterium]|nr:hypothetical protein [Acidobacteriota bacterium]